MAKILCVLYDDPVGGYPTSYARATTAVSILQRAGFGPVLNLKGGFGAWTAAGYPVV